MVIVWEGDPARIVEFRHHTPGNLRAMVQAKLKNLRTGNNFEHRFRADDSIERANMETHQLEFMYKGGDTYHFMTDLRPTPIQTLMNQYAVSRDGRHFLLNTRTIESSPASRRALRGHHSCGRFA